MVKISQPMAYGIVAVILSLQFSVEQYIPVEILFPGRLLFYIMGYQLAHADASQRLTRQIGATFLCLFGGYCLTAVLIFAQQVRNQIFYVFIVQFSVMTGVLEQLPHKHKLATFENDLARLAIFLCEGSFLATSITEAILHILNTCDFDYGLVGISVAYGTLLSWIPQIVTFLDDYLVAEKAKTTMNKVNLFFAAARGALLSALLVMLILYGVEPIGKFVVLAGCLVDYTRQSIQFST